MNSIITRAMRPVVTLGTVIALLAGLLMASSAGLASASTTQVSRTAQPNTVTATAAVPAAARVARSCTRKDKRGVRYTSGAGYRVAARCESRKRVWAYDDADGSIIALVASMCGLVAALGSPVGGAVCAVIIGASVVYVRTLIRDVRNNRRCFAVIRNYRPGRILVKTAKCRYRRGAVPRIVS